KKRGKEESKSGAGRILAVFQILCSDYIGFFSVSFDPVWVRVVCFYVSLMAPSPLASSPPLGLSFEKLNLLIYYYSLSLFVDAALTLRSEPLSLMANVSSSRFGTLLVKNAFALSPPVPYYRGAMGILLVYDVTDESSFNNIRNWIRNIEQHASDNVNKILVGNKADMDESKRAVPTAKGQALADEYGIKFFETSAKTNLNVEEVFFSIGRDIKQRLSDTDSRAEPATIRISQTDQAAGAAQATQKSACCGS
ncbi:hypothetical protein DY000_02008166, partial [Brassica cretica]